ncbi:sugar ABC transporter permease [Subtercola vilae]|uniref:Sugar ABC transporter permease n=2 Tax=Subtercola vilae TaxID=2056433 RepID=A0A4T2BXE7_9MICO|nr:sugar ABC transporter permease [Subtercola sp. RTI3]MEA9986457.1 sugar ABC transporter permease [Subtercola sp. RTI3]TIH34318.1 sugar ABC transporter permease [Subtercola vilae]
MALERTARRRPGKSNFGVKRGAWIFLLPAAAIYLFVVLWPSIQGAGFALTDWNGLNPVKNFIGFDNFVKLFNDQKALTSVWHTLVIAVTITVVQNLVGLLLALGVNTRIKSRNVLRVVLFAPAIITPVATGYLWQNLLGQKGAVNEFLGFLGLPPHTWLGDSNTAIWAICVVIVWQFAGYSMVIFLANLQGISQEVIEASKMDGAGPIRRFWSIIRPELAPSITINLMLSIIGGLKIFDQVWVMTGGGPGGSTETMSTFLYKNAFQFGDFAYGIAIAVVLTVLVAIISAGQFALLGRQNKGD